MLPIGQIDCYFTLNSCIVPPSPDPALPFTVIEDFDDSINIVYIHPFLSNSNFLGQMENANGVVLVTYGLGNFPIDRKEMMDAIEEKITQ
jgi:L-asparaginase/Glu-tRNA(Gln) amidotransferase subunit D